MSFHPPSPEGAEDRTKHIQSDTALDGVLSCSGRYQPSRISSVPSHFQSKTEGTCSCSRIPLDSASLRSASLWMEQRFFFKGTTPLRGFECVKLLPSHHLTKLLARNCDEWNSRNPQFFPRRRGDSRNQELEIAEFLQLAEPLTWR